MNETDQEQIESLKQFWAKWGMAIIGSVVLLAVLMIGTNVWTDKVKSNKEMVSDDYQLIVQLLSESATLDDKQVLALTELTNGMKSKYSDSVYTALSAFNVAAQLVKSGDVDAAILEFDYVIENVNDTHTKEIAIERKAKLLLEKGEFETALKVITSVPATSMQFQFESTKANILAALGQNDEAKIAYESAIELGNSKGLSVESLELKLNDLSIVQ